MNLNYLHKSILADEFEYAIEKNKQRERGNLFYFVAVAIELPNTDAPEVIINPPENLENKLRYYIEAYDDHMKLKANPEVRIVDCEWLCKDSDVTNFIEDHTKSYLYDSYLDM